MEIEGSFLPATERAARERYETLGPVAEAVVRAVTTAMEFEREEYERRVTDSVVETAHDALFASMLAVRVGTRDEYQSWRTQTDHAIHETGSKHVEGVVWHAPPFAEEAVAATYQNERQAAVETLRRQAFGRLYRETVTNS
jgi:hypothetical protein